MDRTTFKERFKHQDPRLVEAAERLANAAPRAYIVGGFVRDVLLGEHPMDLDMEVYGLAPEQLEDLLNRLYPGLVNTVGRSFGILKVNLGEEIEFDVAIPRRESKTGPGHKGFSIEGDPDMTVEEASRRRDFTINAIMADPLTGEVIDLHSGSDDLEKKILRVVDAATFPDDPLRVYRALQLAARFDLTVERETAALMRTMVARGDLAELAPERVTDELKKLFLKSNRPSVGFELARELGVIETQFPELHALIGTPQEPEWHPEGDVWIHTMMVIDEAANIAANPFRGFSDEERIQVVFGALCHDLGKPSTTQVLDGRIRSRGHEEAGVEPTLAITKRLTFGERIEQAALAIVKDHLKPAMLYLQREKCTLTDEQYTNAVRKLVKRIYPTSWRVFLAAAEADFRGRGVVGVDKGPFLYGDLFVKTVEAHGFDTEPTKPLVQGRDLADLGVSPGPKMGEIIAKIEEMRDEGRIKMHEEAMEEAKKLLKS